MCCRGDASFCPIAVHGERGAGGGGCATTSGLHHCMGGLLVAPHCCRWWWWCSQPAAACESSRALLAFAGGLPCPPPALSGWGACSQSCTPRLCWGPARTARGTAGVSVQRHANACLHTCAFLHAGQARPKSRGCTSVALDRVASMRMHGLTPRTSEEPEWVAHLAGRAAPGALSWQGQGAVTGAGTANLEEPGAHWPGVAAAGAIRRVQGAETAATAVTGVGAAGVPGRAPGPKRCRKSNGNLPPVVRAICAHAGAPPHLPVWLVQVGAHLGQGAVGGHPHAAGHPHL